jgi:hypothetical protein
VGRREVVLALDAHLEPQRPAIDAAAERRRGVVAVPPAVLLAKTQEVVAVAVRDDRIRPVVAPGRAICCSARTRLFIFFASATKS